MISTLLDIKGLQEILDYAVYAYKLGKENIENEDTKFLEELLKMTENKEN